MNMFKSYTLPWNIWWFPEIRVPQNHPFQIGMFHYTPFLDTTIYGNPYRYISWGKKHIVSCRFSLQPIHWLQWSSPQKSKPSDVAAQVPIKATENGPQLIGLLRQVGMGWHKKKKHASENTTMFIAYDILLMFLEIVVYMYISIMFSWANSLT